MQLLMQQVQGETDSSKIAAIAEVLKGEAAELEEMAKKLQEAANVKPMTGYAEVVLTTGQRDRIKEQTGMPMQSVFLPDERGILAKTMKQMKPSIIEVSAVREAEKLAKAVDAQGVVDALLIETLAQLDALVPQAHEEYGEQLAAAKKGVGK